MTLIQEIHEIKKLFRQIEKLTIIKCVHLRCACEYVICNVYHLCIPYTLHNKYVTL